MEQRKIRDIEPGQVFFKDEKAWLVLSKDYERKKADVREIELPESMHDDWLLVDGYLEKKGRGRLSPDETFALLQASLRH